MPDDELADETANKLRVDDEGSEDDVDIAKGISKPQQDTRQPVAQYSRGIRDVTHEFAAAAKQLPPGQLVKDDFFTLFEAVGALEIMDPKMDSGCIPEGDTFESTYDVCQPRSIEEIIWIMDELFCLENAWHEGYPLAQTVFTSLHIDRLLSPDNKLPYTFTYGQEAHQDASIEDNLVHVVLRVYCVALIKCCHLVLHMVQSQNYYEEEDFVTHLFGRELLPDLGAEDTIRDLDGASRTLLQMPVTSDARGALLARLQLRKSYLISLIGTEDHWAVLTKRLATVDQTHDMAKSIPDAFSDKVQRQLASNTPPRPMLAVSWRESAQRWTQMFDDIVEAKRLVDFWICQSPHCLQRAVWAFASRQPQPSTFARAFIQDLLFANDHLAENITHFDLLLGDIRDLVLAGDPLADPEGFQIELTSDPRHKCSRIIEAFMDKAFDEYLNLYRMVCQNRCRIRRTFTQAIPILDSLEAVAREADDALYDVTQQESSLDPLTTWVRSYKLQVMAWTIQLGFETDIYLLDELGAMYWLLAHFTRLRGQELKHSETALTARLAELLKRGPRQHQPSTQRYAAECQASAEWIKSLVVQADATINLATALWRLCGLFTTMGAIRTPQRQYAHDEQLLYDVRMKPYLGLSVASTEVPSLEDMQEARKPTSGSLHAACKTINDDVKGAKAALAQLKEFTPYQAKYLGTEEQWKREIKQMETTCVAISVQVSQIQRVGEKHGVTDLGLAGACEEARPEHRVDANIPSAGKRYHDWWPVPQVTEKKNVS